MEVPCFVVSHLRFARWGEERPTGGDNQRVPGIGKCGNSLVQCLLCAMREMFFCTSFPTKRFWRLRKKLEEGNKSGDTEKLSVLDNKGRMTPLRWCELLENYDKNSWFLDIVEFNHRILTQILTFWYDQSLQDDRLKPQRTSLDSLMVHLRIGVADGAILSCWHGDACSCVG